VVFVEALQGFRAFFLVVLWQGLQGQGKGLEDRTTTRAPRVCLGSRKLNWVVRGLRSTLNKPFVINSELIDESSFYVRANTGCPLKRYWGQAKYSCFAKGIGIRDTWLLAQWLIACAFGVDKEPKVTFEYPRGFLERLKGRRSNVAGCPHAAGGEIISFYLLLFSTCLSQRTLGASWRTPRGYLQAIF